MLQQSAPMQNSVRSGVVGALAGVAIVFLFVLFQATQVYELSDPRAMDEAQLARNLSRGEGFTTKLIRPLSLAKVPKLDRHPDLVNAPAYPYYLSLVFRVLGPSARVASWASGLPFLITIPLVLWLGTKTHSRKVGLLAALATATNLGLLVAGTGGSEITLVGMFFTALALVLVYHQEATKRRVLLTALAGVFAALTYLTNYLFILVLLPVAVLVAINVPERQRVAAVATLVLAFVVVCAPWWGRNFVLTHNPLFTLQAHEPVMGTRTYAGNTLYRSFNPAPLGFVSFAFNQPREVYEKIHDAVKPMYPVFFSVAGLVFTPFFVVALLIPLGHLGLDRMRWATCAVALLLAFAIPLFMPDRTIFLPLAPLILVVAATLFHQLLDLRMRPLTEKLRARWVTIAVTLILLVHGFPVLLQLSPGRANEATEPAVLRRNCRELNALTDNLMGGTRASTNDPIYSDLPWAMAWHADRPSIWLPTTMVDVRRIEQTVGQVQWLTLTRQIEIVATAEHAEGWRDLWRRGLTANLLGPDWRVRQRFAGGSWLLIERVPEYASVSSVRNAKPAATAPTR